jgi:hypothetical protein
MDAGELLRILREVLQDADRSITAALDGIVDFEERGRLDELPPDLAERFALIRRRAVPAPRPSGAHRTRKRFTRESPSRKAKKSDPDIFRQDGVLQIELHRPARGTRLRVVVAGLKPNWISAE